MKRFIRDKYPHGVKLPSERVLSEEHNVSRTLLREVLTVLQSWNVVNSQRGSGISVMDRSHWTINVIPYVLKYSELDASYLKTSS